MADNLEALFAQNSPLVGAVWAGSQRAETEKQEAMKNQELAQTIAKMKQEYGQNEAMNPLRVDALRGTNQGQVLTNQKSEREEKEAGLTQGTRVAATNAKSQGEVDDATYKRVQQTYQIGDEAMQRFGGMPPGVQRTMAMASFFKQNGVDPSTNSTVAQFLQADPQQQLAASQKVKDWLINNNPAYRQAVDVAGVTAASHLQGIDKQVAGQKAVEQMRIEAGKYNKKNTSITVEDRLLKAKTPIEKAEILEQAYALAKAANDDDAAAGYEARARTARQRAAEDAGNRAMGQPGVNPAAVTGLPAKDRGSASAPITPDGGQPQPTPQVAIPTMALKAWGSYDPDAYEYRVGPNGQLQRKAK